MATKALMTVEEFAQMETAETEDYELGDGELVRLSSGTPRHNLIRDLIAHLVWNFLQTPKIGVSVVETDCRIADDTVRRPDVSVFLSARLQAIDMNVIPVPFAPDIAVEVLSPSERAIDVHRKVRDYLSAGGKEVWVVDHVNGEFFVHTNGVICMLTEDQILESPLLPGFSVPVSEIFAA